VIARVVAVAGVLALACAAVAVAAGFPVTTDDLTVVRIAGAVPEESCTITAVADAHVDEAQPDATFGTGPAVEIASGPADRRALVRFDIGSCAIPAGAEVRSARLRAVLTTAPAAGRTWKIQRVTSAWTGLSVTWNTAPAVVAAATDTAQTGTAAGAVVEWDVVGDVAGVVAGTATDSGWRIADADETAPTTVGGALASSEVASSGDRPSLTIRWFD
jgi:hypothetical protein